MKPAAIIYIAFWSFVAGWGVGHFTDRPKAHPAFTDHDIQWATNTFANTATSSHWYVYNNWFYTNEGEAYSLPCVKWHNLKIQTNGDKRRQNEWHTANGWLVRPKLQSEDVDQIELEVCKFCGVLTSTRYRQFNANTNRFPLEDAP